MSCSTTVQSASWLRSRTKNIFLGAPSSIDENVEEHKMMKTAITLIAIFSAMQSAFAAHEVERRVTGGVVRGDVLPDGSTVFKAIPYAAPPVGSLRWKPPQPVTAWQGVRDASIAARACAQADEGWNTGDVANSDEDCLTLSIHVPKHGLHEKLPVYVWIHGGSNRAGSGHGIVESPIYKHGIVVVGIEYRLGVFGFLSSPELTAESEHHSSGNYALLDQIAALKWVQENIAVFGGDAGNVTVGGQSAGAIDIGMLLRSPLALGLFNRAIQESGVLGPPRTAAANEHVGQTLLSLLQLPPGKESLNAMRQLPTSVLIDASKKLVSPSGDPNLLWIESTDDGWVIPTGLNNMYQSDDMVHVDHIIGNTTQEFVFEGQDADAKNMIGGVYGTQSARAMVLYTASAAEFGNDQAIFGNIGTQAITDWTERCPEYLLMKWSALNHRKVWRYEFGLPRPGSARVEHNAELDYVYQPAPANSTPQNWPPLQEYWANFIKFGDPNRRALMHWPDSGADARVMVFLPSGARIAENIHGPMCKLLAQRFTEHDRVN
jgi:para-nitrobenzyl esterase